MNDFVYKVIELVGTSQNSISEAIENAVSRANETLRNLGWFEGRRSVAHWKTGWSKATRYR